MSTIDDPDLEFIVVVNDEGQYSIWPEFRPVPAGWQPAGFRGVRAQCLEHIAQVWKDMAPRSLQAQRDAKR